jgi:hypothetical protein
VLNADVPISNLWRHMRNGLNVLDWESAFVGGVYEVTDEVREGKSQRHFPREGT